LLEFALIGPNCWAPYLGWNSALQLPVLPCPKTDADEFDLKE